MSEFSDKIINWYHLFKRDLPWRQTRNPFHIWLSEIILQQTRVNQGLDYFLAFTHRFSTIEDLALASENEVLRLWQGLGYYSRARFLHEGARQIIANYDGKFPEEYDKILTIKGIGEYTAAAIASICFDLPCPVLDGNVYRVMARYRRIPDKVNSTKGKKKIYTCLHALIDPRQPGNFNQALMELGAMVCTPRNPQCMDCPLHDSCEAFLAGETGEYPVKTIKKVPQNRYFQYIIPLEYLAPDFYTILYKRSLGDIWARLFEFPLIETEKELSRDEITQHPVFLNWFGQDKTRLLYFSHRIKHQLTHRTLYTRFYIIISANSLSNMPKHGFIRVKMNELTHYPFPRLIESFLSNPHIINILSDLSNFTGASGSGKKQE
ncbi:MAG: A/G-specific adenine glycosylase [Bacteroidetes bacterium]|nr:A/G-specific adenine glycosylase [Bacteroidota bacterium]